MGGRWWGRSDVTGQPGDWHFSRKVAKNKKNICYLCGKPILNGASRDHCPPSQFFPKKLKKTHNPSALITIPCHETCNTKYSLDEEYFLISLGCVVEDQYIREALQEDFREKFKNPKRQLLYHQVKKEFKDRTEGGIYYPNGKLGKKVDLKRIDNVVWKVVRGIFYHEKGIILDEKARPYIRIMDPQQDHPKEVIELFELIKSKEEKGQYGRLFAYKIAESNPPGIYSMGLIFWNHVMFLVIFHAPGCPCEECIAI